MINPARSSKKNPAIFQYESAFMMREGKGFGRCGRARARRGCGWGASCKKVNRCAQGEREKGTYNSGEYTEGV